MDVTIGRGDGFSSEPASDNAARTLARDELNAVMTNPAHPMHGAYTRGQTAVVDQHLRPFYDKAAAASVPSQRVDSLSLGPAEPMEGETPEEAEVRARNEVILAPLKQEWGSEYETRFAQARATACTLFEGQGEMLDHLGTIVRMQYGPKGEAAALKFFAELEAIKQGRLSST